MNYGPLIFLAGLLALASSWFGLVLTPQMQLGQLGQTNSVPSGSTYPVARPGLASQGAEVYRANGCAYCHSQQVGQTATVFDVLLMAPGTNSAVVLVALKQSASLSDAQAAELLGRLPATVQRLATKEAADATAKAISVAGAKAQVAVVPTGPDIARGWGRRRSVAEDYLFDSPVMLGSQRVGPDLANVGLRLPEASWHLRHLYGPRLVAKGSLMPPYRFLFETRKIEHSPSPDALLGLDKLAPPAGYEVVPKPEAKALVAYLLSLHADAPLFNAPLSMAPAAGATASPTNAAPQVSVTASNSPATTNAPVKP